MEFTTYEGSDKRLKNYNDEESEKVLSALFANALGSCMLFPNLQAVQVNFAQVCSSGKQTIRQMYRAEESVKYQHSVLTALFSSLSSTLLLRFQSLSIRNLQNYTAPSFAKSKDFLSVLSNIKELRLRIVVENDSADDEASWRLQEMNDFFTQLPKTWLHPASGNLERLIIHAEHYWGYIPKCDLRSIHLPKLRRLELGNYSFSHDWQLDWILSHADTLEELTLDDCPILAHSEYYGIPDKENYPMFPRDNLGREYRWEYRRTWAHYFSMFQEKLPKLKVFRFVGGDWEGGSDFDNRGRWMEGPGLPVKNYMNFTGGISRNPGEVVHRYLSTVDEGLPDEERIETIDNVFVYEEDADAYRSLMQSLRNKR